MGLAIVAYLLLGFSGGWMVLVRKGHSARSPWLRPFHIATGVMLISLVLLLLGIGLVGTWGHYGSLGHSAHLPVGLAVVDLVFLSAWSAVQIRHDRPWARLLHVGANLALLLAFVAVSLTGWSVVQKYLP